MEPPSKRICVTADDRLSDLPDCLIHNILSFLESRQVVRSSVLSQRWRHLWRSVPCLDIDFTVFRRRTRCRSRKCCKRMYRLKEVCVKDWQPFELFGNNLLLLHNVPVLPPLDKLRIHVPTLLDYNDRQTCWGWITRGVQRSPAMIDIHMDFCWSSAVNYWCLPDLGSTSRRLTRLLLHGVKLDDKFAEQLRSGYAVLQELSLVRCSCHFGEIVSGTLRRLAVDDCVDHGQFQGMVVAAPMLTSLHTSLSTSYCPNGICVTDDTPSLIKAAVCVTTCYQARPSFFERLCKIFNVRHLELFGARMMENLQRMSDKLPKFHNVRTLLIDRCSLRSKENIQTLDRFLQSVPSLEKLTLQNCEFTDRSKRRTARVKWRNIALESQNFMSFKCDNLEVIEIKHSKDDNMDEFFELLMGLWRNLGKTNIKLTKV